MNAVRQTVTNHYAGCQKQFKADKWSCLFVTKVRNTYCSESAGRTKWLCACVYVCVCVCVWWGNMNIQSTNKTKHREWRETLKKKTLQSLYLSSEMHSGIDYVTSSAHLFKKCRDFEIMFPARTHTQYRCSFHDCVTSSVALKRTGYRKKLMSSV